MEKEEQDYGKLVREEFARCAMDPVYFFKKYGTIQHPTRGRLKFILYKFQGRVLEELMENDYNIILKSRQMGISTLTAAFALWTMLFQKDKNILVIATKQEVAKNLVHKVRYMFDNLPSWLKIECVEANKLSLRFNNGSAIKAISAAADSGRSEAVSMLIIDEAAFIDDIDAIWTSAQQTLSTGGKAIILSTPNGVGNFFHKTWIKAESGENNFHTIRLHWSMHPERQQAWRDQQDQLLGVDMAKQECDASFLASGRTVVPLELQEMLKKSHMVEPQIKTGFQSDVWIWENPDPIRKYMICADVARGDGADHSAFIVLDLENVQQVAEFYGKIPTRDFGNMLVMVGTAYNDAIIVVDNSNMGWDVVQQIISRRYQNLFYTEQDVKYVDSDRLQSNKINQREKKKVPGFTLSQTTRPLTIGKMETYFRDMSIIMRSSRFFDELMVFIWKNGRPEAMQGYNDDLVMALCIGLWVRDTALIMYQNGLDMTRKTLDAFTVTTMPENDVMTVISRENVADLWTMPTGINGEKIDLTEWL